MSKPWKLVERDESFEVQDSASRTLAFVYFSDDPRRCAFYGGPPSPGRTQVRDRTPVIFTAYFDESDTHGLTLNVVMAGFIGTPYQWERFDKRLAKLQRRRGFSIFHSTEFQEPQICRLRTVRALHFIVFTSKTLKDSMQTSALR